MTHVLSRVLRQLLIDLGIGTSSGDWTTYYAGQGDTPDKMLSFVDTQSTVDREDMHAGSDQRWAFQLMVRSTDTDSAKAKAEAARTALLNVYDRWVTVQNTAYVVHCITGLGSVLPLGADRPNSNRSLCSLNGFAIVKEI